MKAEGGGSKGACGGPTAQPPFPPSTDFYDDTTNFFINSLGVMDEKVDISSLMEAFEGDPGDFLSLDPDALMKFDDVVSTDINHIKDEVLIGGSSSSSPLHSPSSTDGSTEGSPDNSPYSSLSGEPSPESYTSVISNDEVFNGDGMHGMDYQQGFNPDPLTHSLLEGGVLLDPNSAFRCGLTPRAPAHYSADINFLNSGSQMLESQQDEVMNIKRGLIESSNQVHANKACGLEPRTHSKLGRQTGPALSSSNRISHPNTFRDSLPPRKPRKRQLPYEKPPVSAPQQPLNYCTEGQGQGNVVFVLPPSTALLSPRKLEGPDLLPLSYPQILPKSSPTESRSVTPVVGGPGMSSATPGPWIPTEEGSSSEGPGSEFAQKREQRKIRNREAAQQSRQRRKEYLETMKEQLDSCEKEKEKLRLENLQLREALNEHKERLKSCRCHFPPPPPNSSSRVLSPGLKKSSALCLAALMFLFTINLGPVMKFVPSQLSRSTLEGGGIQELAPPELGAYDVGRFHSRSLMSFSEKVGDSENKTKILRKRELVVDPPTSPLNGSVPEACRHLYVNQTESIRLDDELRTWMQMVEKFKTKPGEFAQSPAHPIQPLRKPKKLRPAKNLLKRKQNKALSRPQRQPGFIGPVAWLSDPNIYNPNRRGQGEEDFELQMFASPEYKYLLELNKALKRQDDTFYLISFQKDYLLLPAMVRNNTSRPRMSLIVPVLALNASMAEDASNRQQIAMMKIECEVRGMGLVHLPDTLSHPPNSTKSKEA